MTQQQSDRRLSSFPGLHELTLPVDSDRSVENPSTIMKLLLRPRSLLVIALVAYLSTGLIVVKKMIGPNSSKATSAAALVNTNSPEVQRTIAPITAELAPFQVTGRNTKSQIAEIRHSLPQTTAQPAPGVEQASQKPTKEAGKTADAQNKASPLEQDDGVAHQATHVANPAKPVIHKQAFSGQIFGVATVKIVIDDKRSLVVPPDQPISVTERDQRTSYGVVTPSYRNKGEGDFQLVALNVQFLFRGHQPLNVSLHSSQGSILLDEQIQVEQDQNRYGPLLNEWWTNYAQQREGYSSEFYWLHRSVAEMLSRRLHLRLPDGWSKKLQRRSMAKVEQDFERILSTLLGIDSVLIAMGQESTPINDVDLSADQPLPAAINIRPIRTGSFARQTKIEEIAMHVPQECFYVRCGSLHNYEWLRNFVTHWNGSLEEIVKVAATDRGVRQRLENQLVLDLESCKRLGLEKEISDVAIIGCDLHFDDGPAIGVVFEAKDSGAVQRVIEAQRHDALSNEPDAKQYTIRIRQHPVSFVQSPGNVIRSFSVILGKYHLVTNSEFIVRRFIESTAGRGSLGGLDEFRLARQKVPSAESSVVQIYLSDPFFRQVVSPKFRIEASRRQRAVEELKQLALASAIARAEGINRISIAELRELEYLPWHFNHRGDASAAQIVGASVSDTLRGAWGTFKPIADMQLDLATRSEVSNYKRFASRYQRQWRRMDPVVANLSVTPNAVKGRETVKLDVLVVPYARQRYAVFNQYLASANNREIGAIDNDLIAVFTGLRSPRGGTMLARMGIQDDSIEYRIEDGQVLTAGIHRGKTLARNNLYVLVDSAGIDGLKRVGGFVQSLQGNSPVPAKTTRRGFPTAFELLSGAYFVRLCGNAFKAGSIDTRNNWTIISPRKSLRERLIQSASAQRTAANSQVRFQMRDIQRSQAYDYINAYTYIESRKVSWANTALLNYVGQQLPLSLNQAPAFIEQVLGVELVCPLGRKYHLANRSGYQYWAAESEENESYFDITSVPAGYHFPFLDWLRGMDLEFNLSRETLTSKVRLITRQTLRSQPGIVNSHEHRPNSPWEISTARDDTAIKPGDAVIVTVKTAPLRLKTGVLAEIPRGQCLTVLKTQGNWFWTFVNTNGKRTKGWVDIRQVAHRGRWALLFDGIDDHVAAPNIAFGNYENFTVEAWVRDWKGGILCQGRAGDPENSLWLSTGTLTNPGLPHESCGWENGSGRNFEFVVGNGVPSKWNHVAMVYDGMRQLYFLNGKVLRSRYVPRPGPLDKTRILILGAHDYGADGLSFGSGMMGSIRISKVARYGADFRPTRLFCPDVNTILLYQFDEGKSTTLHDSSGQGRHATVAGAHWISRSSR